MPVLTSRVDKPSALALVLIAIWILGIATGFAAPHGWITTHRGTPAEGDYLGFYAAGQLADAGRPASAYDVEVHAEAVKALRDDPNGGDYPWSYPPTFLLMAAAFALVPFYAAALTWGLGTLALFTAAIARISATRRDLLLMLATPAPWLNLYIGQNGALTAALMGFGLILLPARPLIAGIAIGLLSFKPHIGLLIPVALLAARQYRAFAAAVVTVAVMAVISIAAFGVAPWLAWPARLENLARMIQTAAETEKIESLFGLARGLGMPPDLALWLQAALTATLVALIGWLWNRRDVSFDLKAAALVAAATLATPYQYAYDLPVLTVAQAFLLRYLSQRSPSKGEVYALVIANVLVLAFAAMPPIPLGVFGTAIVLAVILRRVRMDLATSGYNRPAAEKLNGACLAPELSAGNT